jgi:GIY-YIG catalytic domain/NADH dehydrogenase
MLYLPTLISVIEVLLVTVPVLLTVAYVTVAERKTMASMQRRLGPNAVGHTKIKFSFKRLYHSSGYGEAINSLYKNRKAPVKPFKENVVSTCENLLSSTTLGLFFKGLKGKGGIYMFTLKNNPDIYYIGRAKDFQKRFKSHLNVILNDRFHTFANTIGRLRRAKFEFSIIEICNLDTQQERENYFSFRRKKKIFTLIKHYF